MNKSNFPSSSNKMDPILQVKNVVNNRKTTTKYNEMSPEAKRVMQQVKAETKDNIHQEKINLGLNLPDVIKPNCESTPTSVVSVHKVESLPSIQRVEPKAQRRERRVIQKSHRRITSTNTASRSRSSLSRGEPQFSISDNMDYDTSLTTQQSLSNFIEEKQSKNGSDKCLQKEEISECYKLNDIKESSISTENKTPKSFVLALDKALEKNCVSRLRGDITDTSRLAESGTVRALDGGRLTNAQEVVVNVCHDDDKEIVFHDDDEQSINTAKTMSHIRVNIWMEYNKEFEPANEIVDIDNFTNYGDHGDSIPDHDKNRLSSASSYNKINDKPINKNNFFSKEVQFNYRQRPTSVLAPQKLNKLPFSSVSPSKRPEGMRKK